MESFWATIEGGFSSVGLNNPYTRAVAMGAVGGILEISVKPRYSYTSEGAPRPWKILSPDSPDATLLPPGSTALIFAAFFGLFV